MNSLVERFFEHDVRELTEQLAELEMEVEPLWYPENDELLSSLEAIMRRGLEACRALDEALGSDEELRSEAQSRFREATAPWCNQSWIINRARNKPRGFPGDYQMLLAIYDGVPIARGLGGYLDRFCLNMTLGKAVEARLQDAKAFLQREIEDRDGPLQVLDIASGPGREFQGEFETDPTSPVHMTCIDSDAGALEYVRRHVSAKSSSNLQFTFRQYNALKLRSAASIIEQFGRQDIIYSVGLADYIPDRLLIPMLASWKESLQPGGCVYVAFKDKNRYDKVEYQWLMDWHFLQRDENDCIRLLERAGYDRNLVDCRRDPTGVILNYTARSKRRNYYSANAAPQSVDDLPHQDKPANLPQRVSIP